MGISNDWQNIDEIYFQPVPCSIRNGSCWTEASAEKIADALSWEIVKFPEEITTIDFSGTAQDATAITMIRPIDNDEPYNIGIFFGTLFRAGGYGYTGVYCYEISTGNFVELLSSIQLYSSYLLMRPSSNGCFCIKDRQPRAIHFDRFYNPKTNKEKWGIVTGGSFLDLYTGLVISYYNNIYYVNGANFGGFVALKKFTAIASNGVYNALTLYKAYIDYSNVSKNIELDGKRYCGVSDTYIPFYLPLAE